MNNLKIDEIIINHYKSIKNPVHLRDFLGFQILVGPNNAGKTNILDAINIFFSNDLEKERFFDSDGSARMTIKNGSEKIILEYKNGTVVNPLDESISKSFIRINNVINYKQVAKEIKRFKLEHPEEYNDFSNTLENYFKGVEINEDLFFLNIYADQKTRSIKRIGEGFKRLFVILYYIFHPQYSVILIDEPEIHLHPSIIKKFLWILEEKKNGKQIFFTTHHPTFIQAKNLVNIWRVVRNENGSTAVYGFYEKDINLNRFVQEINDENSNMLFADKVLLVEGVSDAIFMREMIKRFYKKEKDISVVYTSGKGTIDLYTRICDIFYIPYAVMLDSDALESASLMRVKKMPKFSKNDNFQEKIKKLKENEIFILDRDLEKVYPDHYKNSSSKPLRALEISQKINNEDLKSQRMRVIREVLEAI